MIEKLPSITATSLTRTPEISQSVTIERENKQTDRLGRLEHGTAHFVYRSSRAMLYSSQEFSGYFRLKHSDAAEISADLFAGG